MDCDSLHRCIKTLPPQITDRAIHRSDLFTHFLHTVNFNRRLTSAGKHIPVPDSAQLMGIDSQNLFTKGAMKRVIIR